MTNTKQEQQIQYDIKTWPNCKTCNHKH
jgi:hypothetical protein